MAVHRPDTQDDSPLIAHDSVGVLIDCAAGARATLRKYLHSTRIALRSIGLFVLMLAGSASAQVGMTQLRVGDLPVTVVYATAVVARHQQFGPIDLQVALNAVPSLGNGHLIVISHGTAGDAFTLHTLARTLALAGFVVAQPEHRGDNWQDHSASGAVSWQRRPAEISQTIDAIAANPRFADILGFDKVGVYGMSAGGGTALALAGGNWSVATLQQHCAAHLRDDAGFCLYGAQREAQRVERVQSYLKPLAPGSEAGLAGPAVSDRRVAAVAVSVPVGAIFTAESLAAIHIPVGIVEAQADQVLNPAYHSGYVLANCSACRLLDSVAGGGHFDTLSPWPYSVDKSASVAPGAQRNPAIDAARRQRSYDSIALFFKQQLTP